MNSIALWGPVRIAFSLAWHALESCNDLVLMTQHSPFPNLQACLPWPSR
ncbi:MAG: hypothetical protein PV344_01750 [Anaplasma sp.]|nr:hypothetical protein [Anaplasma sp.]